MDYREWEKLNKNRGFLPLQYSYTQDSNGKYKKDGYMYDVDLSRSYGTKKDDYVNYECQLTPEEKEYIMWLIIYELSKKTA